MLSFSFAPTALDTSAFSRDDLLGKVAVVVPVYDLRLTSHQQLSYTCCLQILGHYPIILVAPESLDTSPYVSGHDNIHVERFDDWFFRGTNQYSKLLLSAAFYQRFLEYEHILVYQLDALVFSDRLLEWCSAGYDYIGAPWLDGYQVRPLGFKASGLINMLFPFWNRRRTVHVGNGGFSLRNVRSCIELLTAASKYLPFWRASEDKFFARHGSSFPWFRIPAVDVALRFSFETEPRRCYRLNHQQLPFGCHAWEKWDIAFWRPIFQSFGYEI